MEEEFILHTGDKRLDNLINNKNKGFKYLFNKPVKILIKGKPGTGKSSLCSQIATQFKSSSKHKKQGVLYYTLEESVYTIERRISYFSPNKEKINFLTEEELEKNLSTIKQPKSNIAIIRIHPKFSDLPLLSKDLLGSNKELKINDLSQITSIYRVNKLVNKIYGDINKFKNNKECERILVIIDSINIILESDIEQVLRSTIRTLINGLEASGNNICFIFVAEATNYNQPEEYLADVVILLNADVYTGSRSLTIIKARDHNIKPSQHKMLIDTKGVRIIPNFLNLNTNAQIIINERCKFGLDVIDNRLTLPLQINKNKTNNKISNYGLPRGSTTLLVGPHGTRKPLLAFEFLRKGIEKKEKICMISFSPQESGIFDVYKDYFNIYNSNKILQVFDIPSLIEEAEDIIIKTTFESEIPPKRLVLHDLSVFLLNYNEQDVYDFFLRFRQYCFNQKITPLCIFSEHHKKDVTKIGNNFKFIADNVISTSIVGEHGIGNKATALCIRKFQGVNCHPVFLEYYYDPTKVQIVLNEEYLADVIESETGKLSLGELRIDYFIGETNALHNLANYQFHLLTTHFPGTANESPKVIFFGHTNKLIENKYIYKKHIINRENLLNSLLFHPLFARRNRTEVLTFDQPWKETLDNLLIPLDDLLTNEEKQSYNILPQNIKEAFKSKKGEIIGLPYYHNYYCLAYRSDLLKCLHNKASYKDLINENGIINNKSKLNWMQISDLAVTAANENHNPEEGKFVIPISYDDYSSDCLASLLISLIGKCPDKISLTPYKDIIRKWLEFAYNIMAIPTSLLNKNYLFPKSTKTNNKYSEERVESVFSMSWYAQILNMKLKYGDNNVHCISFANAKPILGSWGLGILDGSQNTRRALASIRLLRSQSSQREMALKRIAIPPDVQNWNTFWFPEKDQTLLTNSLNRANITGYMYCSRVIADTLLSLLQPINNTILKGKGINASPSRYLFRVQQRLEQCDNEIMSLLN
jgi:KaiC/GvpD/RAD55 family RecA-like ATPase